MQSQDPGLRDQEDAVLTRDSMLTPHFNRTLSTRLARSLPLAFTHIPPPLPAPGGEIESSMPQSDGIESDPNSAACMLERLEPTELQSPQCRKGTTVPSSILVWHISQDFSIPWIRRCCPVSENGAGWNGRNLQVLLQDTDRQEEIHSYSVPQHVPRSTEPFPSPRCQGKTQAMRAACFLPDPANIM